MSSAINRFLRSAINHNGIPFEMKCLTPNAETRAASDEYDASMGSFQNLSDIPSDVTKKILRNISLKKPNTQCAKRTDQYMKLRHYYKSILKTEFVKKGGNIQREVPHYMVVEQSPWLSSWFENSAFIKISIEEFDKSIISFTYGGLQNAYSI